MDEWKKHSEDLRVKENEVYSEKSSSKKDKKKIKKGGKNNQKKKKSKKVKTGSLQQLGTFEIDLKEILDVYAEEDNIPSDIVAAQSRPSLFDL